MNPLFQEILHQIHLRLAELEAKNKMLELECSALREKIRELEHAQEREKALPIIAMTASLLKTEIDSCYNAGMNNYIPKPYKIEELIVPIFKELNSLSKI